MAFVQKCVCFALRCSRTFTSEEFYGREQAINLTSAEYDDNSLILDATGFWIHWLLSRKIKKRAISVVLYYLLFRQRLRLQAGGDTQNRRYRWKGESVNFVVPFLSHIWILEKQNSVTTEFRLNKPIQGWLLWLTPFFCMLLVKEIWSSMSHYAADHYVFVFISFHPSLQTYSS